MDIEKKKVKEVGVPWRSEYIAGRMADGIILWDFEIQ